MGTVAALLGRGQPLFIILFAALIIFFVFFYTAVVFNPDDVADNLKKHGGFVPGIRPGQEDGGVSRLRADPAVGDRRGLSGARLSVAGVVDREVGVPFYFGGTSLLIVVSVTMDTITQIQSHLMAHQYQGLIEKSKIRGKSRSGGNDRRQGTAEGRATPMNVILLGPPGAGKGTQARLLASARASCSSRPATCCAPRWQAGTEVGKKAKAVMDAGRARLRRHRDRRGVRAARPARRARTA